MKREKRPVAISNYDATAFQVGLYARRDAYFIGMVLPLFVQISVTSHFSLVSKLEHSDSIPW
jgi:hypothetical protein